MIIGGWRRLRLAAALLETGNLLTVKLALRRPGMLHRFPGDVYRRYVSLVGESIWRSRTIFEILEDLGAPRRRVILEATPGEGLSDALDELAYLSLITSAVAPKRVFEIGTFRGRTALHFALNSPNDAEVLTLDLPRYDRARVAEDSSRADSRLIRESDPASNYASSEVAGKIRQLWGDSKTFDFAPYRGTVDLFFIDGGHDYRTARRDTENALTCVRPGGVILWHDWGNYGAYNDVVRAVRDVVGFDAVCQIADSELAYHRVPLSA